jgi:rubrerythrin
MCLRKIRYRTEEEAKIETEKANIALGTDMHWYRCPFCGYWHKGHGRQANRYAD